MSTRRPIVRLEDVLPTGWIDTFSRDHRRIAIGVDLGTTTKDKSNPTAVAVGQQVGLMNFARVVLRFKNDDPAVLRALLLFILEGLRGAGLSARRLCIDATNERFFAVDLRREFAGKVPVELIINSEKTTYGGEEMLWKAYLANLFINTIDDGYLALPPGKWLQTDIRQTIKDRGTFVCDVLEDGGHGDCHRALENMLHGLVAKGGPVEASPLPVGSYRAGRGVDPRRERGRLRSSYRSKGPRRPI